MGHLDKLEVSNRVIVAARPRRKIDTDEYRRKKLIANIEEQIELVGLSLKDKPLQLERKRGHGVVTVRPRLWWKVMDDGTALTQIRYNKVALNIAGRGTTIEAGSLKDLVEAYHTVIRAVLDGELDPAIETAAFRSQPIEIIPSP